MQVNDDSMPWKFSRYRTHHFGLVKDKQNYSSSSETEKTERLANSIRFQLCAYLPKERKHDKTKITAPIAIEAKSAPQNILPRRGATWSGAIRSVLTFT
jgi:hypothetical protein